MAWSKTANDYHLKTFYNGIMKENALLYKYQFVVDFQGDDIQDYGFCDQSDPSKNITYLMQSATIPGVKLDTGKTTYFGTEFRIPGVKQYGHNWKPKILLNQSLFGYKALQAWQRDISRLEIDGGGIKTIPNVIARLHLLSADHQQIVTTYILEGVWIKGLSEIQLAYQTNGGQDNVTLDADFRYQYSYEAPEGSMDSDPLHA